MAKEGGLGGPAVLVKSWAPRLVKSAKNETKMETGMSRMRVG